MKEIREGQAMLEEILNAAMRQRSAAEEIMCDKEEDVTPFSEKQVSEIVRNVKDPQTKKTDLQPAIEGDEDKISYQELKAYKTHIAKIKYQAREFRSSTKNMFKILKPIAEDSNTEQSSPVDTNQRTVIKSVYKRCHKDIKLMSIGPNKKAPLLNSPQILRRIVYLLQKSD